MDALRLVLDASKEIRGFDNVAVDSETKVFGRGALLDSLDFVAFLVAVERRVKEAENREIRLMDSQLLWSNENPYRTIGSMAGLVNRLCVGRDVVLKNSGKEEPEHARRRIKLIMCDLDGTLWDGVAGEGGSDRIHLRAGTVDTLADLNSSGIVLGLVTANSLRSVKPFIDAIKRLSFVPQYYDTIDKAEAIKDACDKLNIGTDSMCFLDDDPVQRNWVRKKLPDVWVPDNHDDIATIDVGQVTAEDKQRTEMYIQEYDRKSSRKDHSDYIEWLKSLNMVMTVSVACAGSAESERAMQLLERANQFNFTKRHDYSLPYAEFTEYVFALRDRFGHMGIIGVARVDNAKIVDCAVSCRVLGRGVEEAMFKWLRERIGIKEICVAFTENNKRAAEWFYSYCGDINKIVASPMSAPVFVEDVR